MLVTSGTHLSVPFHPKEKCKLGSKCACTHTEKAGSEPKKRKKSVVVPTRTICEWREERGPTLGQSGRSPNALSCKQLGSGAEFMEFAREKARKLHKNRKQSKGRMDQLKRKLSHLGQIANVKIEKLWTAAHLAT